MAATGSDEQLDEFLPARLHYFLRAQAGLHVCLHPQCPGREKHGPAFFVSRKNERTSKGLPIDDCPDGCCPDCHGVGWKSLLVEVVSCRKCGYLFGALQDLGPRHAQRQDRKPDERDATFDTFSTELGWAADSFWSYFSVDGDLPFPSRSSADDEEAEQLTSLDIPQEIEWCVSCGRKRGAGANSCACSQPPLRSLRIFHRQCEATDTANLYVQTKKLLPCCPNCGARNSSGIEPLQRFQESEDETGMAIAIPLAHFQVTPQASQKKLVRKLLCFADHRQRAAAFPSLLEEETFTHDCGRKIVRLVQNSQFVSRGLFTLALKKDGSLFRYNLGPRNEGFVLCPVCGCSKPKSEFRAGRQHRRLRPYAKNMNCLNANLYGVAGPGIAYGHEFHSFCLIARPSKKPESVESLMFALQKGLCQVLELDNSDIGVSCRWLNKRTAENTGIEIILYDRTPGGAGFVEEGMNRWDEVVAAACSLCEPSPTHQCDAACYDCLKDFGNQQYHDMLDRNTVLRFFK